MSVPARLAAHWPAAAGVHAFTTLRYGAGASQPPFDTFNLGSRSAGADATEVVERNRAELIERFALPSPPHWLRQVHDTQVLRFDAPASPLPRVEPEADAAVTSVAGVVLAVLSADCLPVVLAADDGGEIAVAHAGWRGLRAGVLENTVDAMRTPAGRILAWLGPAAGPQAYEVGAEVFDAFTAHDRDAASAFIATRPGHWRVDLYALARQRLVSRGVDAIYGGDLCTVSDPQRFFSHRRDQRSGRMATIAYLAH